MPKYLLQVSFTAEGLRGLLKEGGTLRQAVAEKAAQSLGGRLEVFYFAFGETDLYAIADLPDNVSAAALAMTVSASGAVTSNTIVLMTPAEVDQATKKSPSWRPPGQ